MDEDREAEMAELRAMDRAARAYRKKLARNPDCRDPDHPGCPQCMDEDEQEEENADI